ncbi:laccase-13-like [Rutidosis leptorrhynchoides]|uniref:laccase-13-like n=1 Tax=Rutidosis leptorrhynchoides TaxID=125765 RepID=UPI003A9A3005
MKYIDEYLLKLDVKSSSWFTKRAPNYVPALDRARLSSHRIKHYVQQVTVKSLSEPINTYGVLQQVHKSMGAFFIAFVISFLFVSSSAANTETHFRDFVVQETPVKRLCRTKNIITVNGQFPGPTLEVWDGDTLVVNVLNNARYNVTIHWHGIRQLGRPWADGPDRVTQCPIQPGASYTYRFTIINQEGTLWWHAHSQWLRATVYGALIIYPKRGSTYPLELPNLEIPILLGQWWNQDIISVLNQALFSGGTPNISDAFTINGQPGDLYRCSNKDTMKFYVESGDKILIRVINSALNQQLFFTVANHQLLVVAVDALYTKPFTTTTLMLGPGQTTDVILVANQPPGLYYIAARAYESAQNAPFDKTTTTAILAYKYAPCSNQIGTPTKPILPQLPNYNDTATVTAFTTQLKSPSNVSVPIDTTDDLFFTIGLGLINCNPGPTCQGPNNTRFAASMNNVSFVLPQTTSLLQAHYQNIPNVFTTDFPRVPPIPFDYTGNVSRALWQPVPGTKLYKLKFNSQVQIVLHDTAIVSTEDHPVHLHGYHFYIVGQGFGNFDRVTDTATFNLVDPPRRNTVNVPVGGWSVIRFVADNPGVWLMHCHIDSHLTWGFGMSLLVENGPHKLQSVQAPPLDLPQC